MPAFPLRLRLVILTLSFTGCATGDLASMHDGASTNKSMVQAHFDQWRAETGGPFDLLTDSAQWTIVGSSPVSKTYSNKEQFMAEVIRPFNARMDQPLKPTIRSIHAEGDTVIVLFDAESRCIDGMPYRNTYAWFMQFKDGRAVKVTAFFDTRLFDEMWARVAPRS